MPRKDIIQRIQNPIPHYTIEGLKRLAKVNNVPIRRGANKTELLNILEERGIIREHRDLEITNLGVEQQIEPLEQIKELRKKPPTTKRVALQKYQSYIKNIKRLFNCKKT